MRLLREDILFRVDIRPVDAPSHLPRHAE